MLGTGLLKGLAETGRNFVGSYFDRDRLVTIQYPEEKVPVSESFRQFPFLVFDGDDPATGLRCVACQICEKECPPQCIYIEKSTEKKPDHLGKPQFFPAVFDIDVSVCMSCQICAEVCPFDAIKMDQEIELSTADRFGGLLFSKDRLARSNAHFRQLHPTDAAAIDTRREEERSRAEARARAAAEAKAKEAAAAPAAATPGSAAGKEKRPGASPTSPTNS